MIKKLVISGIVSVFMLTATVSGFAATPNLGTLNNANLSQIVKKCNKSNPQLAQILSQIQKKCKKSNANNQDIQSLLQKVLGSNSSNSVKKCPKTGQPLN